MIKGQVRSNNTVDASRTAYYDWMPGVCGVFFKIRMQEVVPGKRACAIKRVQVAISQNYEIFFICKSLVEVVISAIFARIHSPTVFVTTTKPQQNKIM